MRRRRASLHSNSSDEQHQYSLTLQHLYSREPRPELDERRAQPPRLELGHAPHELLEVRLRDVLEVVEVARHIKNRGPEFRGAVRLDPLEKNELAETNIARSTSRASNDSNRISIASQEDFKF